MYVYVDNGHLGRRMDATITVVRAGGGKLPYEQTGQTEVNNTVPCRQKSAEPCDNTLFFMKTKMVVLITTFDVENWVLAHLKILSSRKKLINCVPRNDGVRVRTR